MIPPAVVAAAALLVNPVLGLLFLLWNSIRLKQWGQVLVALVLAVMGAWAIKTRFQLNLTWLMAHFFGAACLILYNRTQNRRYYGYLYDGGGKLALAPLVSFLCALQLIFLGSLARPTPPAAIPNPTPTATAVVTASADPDPNLRGQVYREGPLMVEYKDVELSRVQFVARVLLEKGVCDSQRPSRAAVFGTPEFLGVIAVLPQGVTVVEPQLEAVFQAVLVELTGAQNSRQPVRLEVYFHDRRPAGSYQLSQP